MLNKHYQMLQQLKQCTQQEIVKQLKIQGQQQQELLQITQQRQRLPQQQQQQQHQYLFEEILIKHQRHLTFKIL